MVDDETAPRGRRVTGTLYGLGVGPGDPELLTLKAVRLLSAVDVVAYPAPEKGDGLARVIAGPHVPEGVTELAIKTPMTPGAFPANDVYDRYAAEIANHLSSGRDVAVLCEGDPFLYGSFMYIFMRLAERFPTEVVPGVSSIGACAAAAAHPLVSRNQVLTVLPAPLPSDELERRLWETDAAAIMKVGRHLDKIQKVLIKTNRLEGAVYVARASFKDQRVAPVTELKDETAPYFSMILVRKPEGDG